MTGHAFDVTWCVEMTIPSDPRARWQALHGTIILAGFYRRAVDVSRDEAIEVASLLPRHDKFAYRVRPFRRRGFS